MSVSNYFIKSGGCKYSYTKLKDVLYLVSAEHLKNIHIDGDEVYIEDLTELPLRLNGFDIQFTEEESLDERYRFQKKLTLSMNGYVNYKVFSDKYYAIIQTEDGTYFMINVDFPSRITHTFNLSKDINQTDFTFASLSNYPTMKLIANFEAVDIKCLGYNVNGVDSLKLLEKEKARLDTVNRTVMSTEPFKSVEFMGDSCSIQEIYDGNQVTSTISFSIPFDNQLQWGWHLLEFIENRYVAIVTPKGNDNKYYMGFNFGLVPSYTIQTSNNQGESDVMTITLTEMSMNGSTAAVDWKDEQTTETRWIYVKQLGTTICYECVAYNRARYLVKQEVDQLNNPTGKYQVLEGYESQFPNLHVVDTFDTTDEFENYDCQDQESCTIITSIPNRIKFTDVECKEYTLQASCAWEFINIPSNITVTPSAGLADQTYTVRICNTLAPTSNPVENNMVLTCCRSARVINMITRLPVECIRPTVNNINCLAQTAQFVYEGTCLINVIDSGELTYNVGYNSLSVNVPRNETSELKYYVLTIGNCDCSEQKTITIVQDKQYESWITESGYICESGTSYEVQRKYTGTSASDLVQTSITRKGNIIQTGDTRCTTRTKWEWDGVSCYCVNGNSMQAVLEYISYDGGVTWEKTGKTQLGSLIESGATICDETINPVQYQWRLSSEYACDESFGGKLRARYSDGTTYVVGCNTSLILTSAETRGHSTSYTAMTSAVIGDCTTTIGEGAFANCSGLTSVTISDSVTSIGQSAFNECRSLSSITIPNSVTSIGDGAFAHCALTSITIPNSITSINASTFQLCFNLTDLVIPNSVVTIGSNAVFMCARLTSVTIPSSVTSIGVQAFSSCPALTSITINAVTPPSLEPFNNYGPFDNTNNCPIYVPAQSVEEYKTRAYWRRYADRFRAIP